MNDGVRSWTKQQQQPKQLLLHQDDIRQRQQPKQHTTHDGYRQILSTANKLEAIQSKLDSVIDLFGTPIVSNLFTKLCKDCMSLIFEYEFKLEEFRKAEELVWRRVYHDTYRLLKAKRQLFGKDDELLIESHFMSGISFYSSLIVKLRIKYNIMDMQGVLSPLSLALVPVDCLLHDTRIAKRDRRSETSLECNVIQLALNSSTRNNDCAREGRSTPSDSAKQWAQQCIYRSLVYMGDIARYLIEFSECDHQELSFQLYRSASRYQTEHGLPFNQLATLAGGLNYNLDAVCNYMRCCLRPKPFERAEGNMVKLFDLNKKQHDTLDSRTCIIKISDIIASKDPAKEAESLIKATIITFLKLTSQLWFADGDNLSDELQNNVVNETQKFFEILREAIELDPVVPLAEFDCVDTDFRPIPGGPSSLEKPRYISPTIMYELCSISIMLIARRKKQSYVRDDPTKATLVGLTISDNITDLVNTLALNLLHYATSKCQKMIISKIQELRVSRQEDISTKTLAPRPTPDHNNLRNSSPNSSDAASRRALSRLRQKRAATNYSSGRHRLSVTRDNDTDLSELEETALSTIDALEISSEMSDGDDHRADDLINLDSSSDDGTFMRNSINKALLSKPSLRPTRSQNYDPDRRNRLVANEACNSLPIPDLLTGDITDISFKTNQTIEHDMSGAPSESNIDHSSNSSQATLESTLSYIYNQTYLPTIKVFFDWLLSDVVIIDSNLESFTSYQSELSNTVNLLIELKKLIKLDDKEICPNIYRHAYNGHEWIQKYPMSCDYPFVNLSPMHGVHDANIDFALRRELSDSESGFLTIECVLGFSHALTIFLRNKTMKR